MNNFTNWLEINHPGDERIHNNAPWDTNGVKQSTLLPHLPIEWVKIQEIKPVHGRNKRPGKPIDPDSQYEPLIIDGKNELQDGYHRYFDLIDRGYTGKIPVVRYRG